MILGKWWQQMPPGQFLHIRVLDGSKPFAGPISISEIDRKTQTVASIYRISTTIFPNSPIGSKLSVMGPQMV